LLVSPTAYPVILRPTSDGIVDFTDVTHYMQTGRGFGMLPSRGGDVPVEIRRTTVRQPPPPPPKAPPWRTEYEEGEGRSSSSAPSVSMFSTFPRYTPVQQRGVAGATLEMSPNMD